LASLSPAETARQLSGKFGFENTGGGNHDRYKLVIGKTLVAYVDLDRHKEPYRDKVIGYMARQLGVRGPVFKAMIECTVDRAAFLAIKGVPPAPRAVQPGAHALPPAPRQVPPTADQQATTALPPAPQQPP
jgi:hypothetical protein